jgi:hypothetical protein
MRLALLVLVGVLAAAGQTGHNINTGWPAWAR